MEWDKSHSEMFSDSWLHTISTEAEQGGKSIDTRIYGTALPAPPPPSPPMVMGQTSTPPPPVVVVLWLGCGGLGLV